MNYKNMTLDDLKNHLIFEGKKGYPFFIAGTVYWLVMFSLGFFIESKSQLALCYLVGTCSIFPLAIAVSKVLKVNLLSNNPLGVLGGIVGGIQAFFLPVWIVIYIEQYELIPMAIGVLGASHFLPYLWVYKSKTYCIFTITMALISFIFGYILISQAFLLLPILLSILYLLTAIILWQESKAFILVQEKNTLAK
ncbi:hypothetical protein F7731_21820 [Cytobacillus depressus]|uniref:DUF308 domain-containing protein n=1 Tax=Cytobacillus depressus TaxID=1602942 RepID=A0A6L3V4M1_9BACI|nr:hypothetical protein [Cytobacillus depressus]KAB2329782.1 hypothetical protein F7731_21820 [Cytobacillus depressus]